jgi:hypothetical protein
MQIRMLASIKLVFAPALVAIALVLSVGSPVQANGALTHPFISGPHEVKSQYYSAVLPLKGSGFTPYGLVNVFVAASPPGWQVTGSQESFFAYADGSGNLSTQFGVSGLYYPGQWFQLWGSDITTGIYTNLVTVVADSESVPVEPRISSSDHLRQVAGCANLNLSGSGFAPYAGIQVFVASSTDGLANYQSIYPNADATGAFSAVFPICGIGAPGEQVLIAAEDFTTYLYANTRWISIRT